MVFRIAKSDDIKKIIGRIHRKRMTMQCIGNMTSSQSRLVPHLGAWQRASPARRRWWKVGGNGSSPWEVGTKLKISDKCLTGMFVLCVFYRVQEGRINEQINCES